MLAPIWNEEFELPGGSYLISDIQDYFVYIIKKQEKTVNPSIRIYTNQIKNRIMFKIKAGYFKLLTTQTMKLLGGTKSKITNDKSRENVPYLEISEVVLQPLQLSAAKGNCCRNCFPSKNYQQQNFAAKSFLFEVQ